MVMTRQRKQRERRKKRSWERFRETRWAQRNRAQGPGGIWNIHQNINYPLFNLFKWEIMRLWFMASVLRPVCLPVCLTFVYLQRGSFGFTWRWTQSNCRSEDRDQTAAHEADVGLFMLALWGILHGSSHTIIISTASCFLKPYCLFPRFSAALYLPFVLTDTFPSQWLLVNVLCVQSQLTWRGLDQQLHSDMNGPNKRTYFL